MIATSTTHSNAFNFLGFMQGQVDPRTGQYTLGIDLPKMVANDLVGPNLPLRLDFSPLNETDSGYGLGWSINLTQYDPASKALSLITGEHYRVTSDEPRPAAISEQKLVSFEFYKDDADNYRVIHRSGMVEHLRTQVSNGQRVALPHRIYAVSGHWIELTYTRPENLSHLCLSEIHDGTGKRLLWVQYQSLNRYTFHLHPDDGASSFAVELSARHVTDVVLPDAGKANWHFEYVNNASTQGMTCLKTVRTPTGSLETLSYDDAGHLMPAGAPRTRLPKVERHEIDPGFNQPKMATRFAYSAENFMGGNSGQPWTEGQDTLYKVPGSATYFYSSTQIQEVDGEVVRKVVSQYNRYHLLTLQSTEQYGTVAQVLPTEDDKPVKDWHIHETQTVYHEDLKQGFALQPRYFQMAKFTIQRWKLKGDTNKLRQEVTLTEYDEHGNQTLEVQPNGIHTVSEYYPAEASDGCPADPHGFVRSLRQRTVYPAGARPAWAPPEDMEVTLPRPVAVEDGAPVLITRYRYRLFDALSDTRRPASIPSQYLVSESAALFQGLDEAEVPLQLTELGYHNAPGQPALHGRQASEQLTLYNTEAKGLLASQETISTSWHYPRATTKKREAPLEIKETATCKGQQKSSTKTLSSLTGDTLTEQDMHGVVTAYEYDALQRLVKQTIGVGSPNPAERTYSYQLVASAQQQASMTETDTSGVVTCSFYDGLNRIIRQERKTHATQQPQLVYEACHDPLGQLVSETVHDHHARLAGGTLAISTEYAYGAWGERCETLNADGTRQHSAYSPFGDQGDMTATWMTSADQPTLRQLHTLMQDNLNEKPWQVQRLDAEGKEAGRENFFYDGVGQSTRAEQRIRDPLNPRRELLSTTRHMYDAHGRMTRTERPDNTLVSRTFAGHSRNELPETLFVHERQNADGLLACKRRFDGLERLVELNAGPRRETYEYKDKDGNDSEQMLVSRRTTFAKRVFNYSYDPSLSLEPKTITVGSNQSAQYEYDRKTTAISSASNDEGKRSYAYTDQGHLLKETWEDSASTDTYVCDHTTSLQGRPLLREDSDQLTTEHGYDDKGRLSWTLQGNLRADFTYGEDGRLKLTRTLDQTSLHQLDCEQLHDSLGREVERILTRYHNQTKVMEQRITQVWRDDDLLHSRTLLRDGQRQLTETFEYDLRKRLESYLCEGQAEAFPCNAKGRAIEEQSFTYDHLDNLTTCNTWFADGSRDRAVYTCEGFQLKKVTHTHEDYPASRDFGYDDDGNMTNDEAGNRLAYDDHGRLKQVVDAAGQPLYSYRYDGHDHLVGVRPGSSAEVLRRYQNEQLHCTVDGDVLTQYFYDGERPLGLQEKNESGAARLLLTNMNKSVLGESTHDALIEARYSAYGDTHQADPAKALHGLLAFNGEARERALGWYLLGRGYRAYNPGLMRFHSPDSMPPEAAGVNPYQYCLGDPVNWRDPSGHQSVRAPSTPPATGGMRRKKNIPSWQWIALAGAAVFALVTIAPFAIQAAAAIGTIGLAAMSAGAKAALAIGVTGTALQVGGLGMQAAAIFESDPDKAQTLATSAGILAGIGGFMTGGQRSL